MKRGEPSQEGGAVASLAFGGFGGGFGGAYVADAFHGGPTAVRALPRRRGLRPRTRGKLLARRSLASAVVVPPSLLYLASLTVVALASAVGGGEAGLRPLAVAALYLPVAGAACMLLGGAIGWMLVARSVVAATLLLGLDAALPGPTTPMLLLGVILALALAVPPAAGRWRRRWEQFPDVAATLVCGELESAESAIARLERVPGLRIVSVLVPDAEGGFAGHFGRPVHSRVGSLLSSEKRAIVSSPRRDPRLDTLVAQLVARGFDVASESSVLRSAEGYVESELADPLSILLSHPRRAMLDLACRVRDLVLAAVGLVVLAPLFLVVGLAIRIDSRGPVFFRQRRLGARGRPFKVLKFRTMRHDAEAATGPVWATANDPRITRVGRFLRRSRLDELPQLVNVVLGQMSLVGPRPERAHFFRRLRGDLPIFELRTAIRPGITGWAQIRAPYAAATEEARVKLGHDLFYLCRRSFWFDLAILFDTVGVALRGKGAR